jgi:hypothetical protein
MWSRILKGRLPSFRGVASVRATALGIVLASWP